MRVETSERRPGTSRFDTDGPCPLIDRDASDLAFVERVLEEAENTANPVLERAKFLAITGMLLDEFYRIRVAYLREQIRLRGRKRGGYGPKPAKRLRRADKYSNRLIRRQDRCWRALRAELERAGIELVAAGDASAGDREWLALRFEEQIRPRLAPDLSQSPDALASARDGDLLLFAELAVSADPLDDIEAVVPVPADLPRFFALPGGGCRFMAIEEVIRLFLDGLFAGTRITASGLARVLREGSLKRSEAGEDLLTLVRDAIERRERADVIRLRVERGMPEGLMRKLAAGLGLLRPEQIKALEKSRRRATASEFVVADAFLGLTDLIQLVELLPAGIASAHSFPAHHPRQPAFASEFDGDLFRAIAAKDRMLHFPYDDFDILVALIESAAADDAVVAIRQTLYRTGSDALIAQALAAAARNGKAVDVVVEVQAREDETRNIELAAFLESAGVNVSYGLLERKVHAKLLVIDRRESGALRRYVHCSTGNYSIASGHSYTDLCLLSADEALADDAVRLFAWVHGGDVPRDWARISVAPFGLRERIAGLIEREIANAEAGRPAAIWMKLNRLSDERMIRLLYRASQAGVDIEIVVRGICCLTPGVPGVSERIRVKSVVGRFLEHSRAFCFGNGGALPSSSADVFISSADLMSHKLDVRVEMLVGIEDDELKRQIQEDVFVPYLEDQASSWLLGADEKWVRQRPGGYSVQQALAARGTRA
jgi:polyphosphate kinase